jgi:hypothetical protein
VEEPVRNSRHRLLFAIAVVVVATAGADAGAAEGPPSPADGGVTTPVAVPDGGATTAPAAAPVGGASDGGVLSNPPGVPPAPNPDGGAPDGGATKGPTRLTAREVQNGTQPGPRWLHGSLELIPRGIFIINTAWNSGTMTPGSFVFYSLPSAVSKSQFYISPQNTVLGFGLKGISVGSADLSGGLDVTLRSPTPLQTANTISPQFYDVHIQLELPYLRFIFGQYPDILLPFVPDTANSYPSGYVPGAIGYARPQLRVDWRRPLGEHLQLLTKVSADQPVQTFDLSDEAVGRQGGRPDVQARIALALGKSSEAKLAWERPFELGIAGHTGMRRVTFTSTNETNQYRTWSIAGDLRLMFPFGTSLKGRLWTGSELGDYVGGIFQTVDLGTGRAVHAWGFWAEVQQALGPRWRATVIYGVDDPRNSDLSPGARTLNQAGVANLYWDASKKVGLAVEGSRWSTTYVGAGTNTVWRADTLGLMRF